MRQRKTRRTRRKQTLSTCQLAAVTGSGRTKQTAPGPHDTNGLSTTPAPKVGYPDNT